MRAGRPYIPGLNLLGEQEQYKSSWELDADPNLQVIFMPKWSILNIHYTCLTYKSLLHSYHQKTLIPLINENDSHLNANSQTVQNTKSVWKTQEGISMLFN